MGCKLINIRTGLNRAWPAYKKRDSYTALINLGFPAFHITVIAISTIWAVIGHEYYNSIFRKIQFIKLCNNTSYIIINIFNHPVNSCIFIAQPLRFILIKIAVRYLEWAVRCIVRNECKKIILFVSLNK